jgi:uncharacterized protein DUF4118
VVAALRWTALVVAGKNHELDATARKRVNSDQPSLPGDDDLRGLLMRRTTRPIFLRYGGAVLFTALAVLLRWLLDPWLADSLPFPTLFGAVAAAVWLGGYRPGILAAVLGVLACDFLFVEPRGTLGLDNARSLIGVIAYLLSCAVIIGFGERRCTPPAAAWRPGRVNWSRRSGSGGGGTWRRERPGRRRHYASATARGWLRPCGACARRAPGYVKTAAAPPKRASTTIS